MKSIVLFTACAVLSPIVAYAQSEPAPMILTLEEALDRGLASSHRVDEAVARQEAAAAAIDTRRAAMMPQMSALAGYQRTNHVDVFGILLPTGELRVVYPDIPDNYRTRFDIQSPRRPYHAYMAIRIMVRPALPVPPVTPVQRTLVRSA